MWILSVLQLLGPIVSFSVNSIHAREGGGLGWDAGVGGLYLCVSMNEHMHAGPWGKLSNPV